MNAVCLSMWQWLWESQVSCWWMLWTVLEPNDCVVQSKTQSVNMSQQILVFCRVCCLVGLHSCILQIQKGPERDRMVELWIGNWPWKLNLRNFLWCGAMGTWKYASFKSTLTNQSTSITDQRMLTVYVTYEEEETLGTHLSGTDPELAKNLCPSSDWWEKLFLWLLPATVNKFLVTGPLNWSDPWQLSEGFL